MRHRSHGNLNRRSRRRYDSSNAHHQVTAQSRRAVLWATILGTLAVIFVAINVQSADAPVGTTSDATTAETGQTPTATINDRTRTSKPLGEPQKSDKDEVQRLRHELEQLKAVIAASQHPERNPQLDPTQPLHRTSSTAESTPTDLRTPNPLPDLKAKSLLSAWKTAESTATRARQDRDRVKQSQHYAEKRSDLNIKESELRMYEAFANTARMEYESHVQSQRANDAAFALAAEPRQGASRQPAKEMEWTHSRVMALHASVLAMQQGYLNPVAIIQATGDTSARLYTEEEEDILKVFSSCLELAWTAHELSSLRQSRPRPKALRRTANACLTLYNRCADYCKVARRSIDSPTSNHDEAIRRLAAARDREDAQRAARKKDAPTQQQNTNTKRLRAQPPQALRDQQTLSSERTAGDTPSSHGQQGVAPKPNGDRVDASDLGMPATRASSAASQHQPRDDAAKATTWTESAIDALIRLTLRVKELNPRVSRMTLKTFNHRYEKFTQRRRAAKGKTSGRAYELMAKEANKLLKWFNSNVPDEHRVTIDTLSSK